MENGAAVSIGSLKRFGRFFNKTGERIDRPFPFLQKFSEFHMIFLPNRNDLLRTQTNSSAFLTRNTPEFTNCTQTLARPINKKKTG
jgi:hypothetical protein